MRLKRLAIFVHRWLGVAACLLFAIWFPSGIAMMYWDFPSVTAADRLERSPALDPVEGDLSPTDALARLAAASLPPRRASTCSTAVRSIDFVAGAERLVYADTGEEQQKCPVR